MLKCKTCGNNFNPDEFFTGKGSRRSVYCSKSCWSHYNSTLGWRFTAAKIDGDWGEYFKRLVQKKRTKHKELVTLTVDDLSALYKKQKGKCALTGREMGCRTVPGIRFPENASLDRIVAGGPYSPENIQLVCRDVNGFRGDTPLKNFIHICRLVAEHTAKKRV